MNATITSMLVNLGQASLPIQALVTAFGYILGIVFFIIGLQKLKSIADYRTRSNSQIPIIVPLAYFFGGAAIIYIPTFVRNMSATFFGSGNILAYQQVNIMNFQGAMLALIQTVGIIWFIRGITLLVQASSPGIQHGPKGFAFLVAGILALNFEGTMAGINTFMQWAATYTLSPKGF